jgi:hypothetical protein
VSQFFAVTSTISRTTVCQLRSCSIVNKYGNVDGKIPPSFTIIVVEFEEIELTKYETTLFDIL